MSFCRTKSVRMQGLLPMAADVDQIRGRSAPCDQFQTKKRMMALSAYTWPSDSKYWPVYDVISVAATGGTRLFSIRPGSVYDARETAREALPRSFRFWKLARPDWTVTVQFPETPFSFPNASVPTEPSVNATSRG